MSFEEKVNLLKKSYAAFNARDIDRVLASLTPDVAWPNMMEMITIHGRNAVRDYWTGQFEVIDPEVQPVSFEPRGDDVAVKIHQKVTNKDTGHVFEADVTHIYSFRDGLVSKMTVS
jgi:ketosteroid isomerase-like protein